MRRSVVPLAALLVATLSGTGCTLEFDRPTSRGCTGECAHCCDDDAIEGGSFDRGWDRSNDPTQADLGDVPGFVGEGIALATVSDFRLDRLEVTRARFERFVETYDAWRASGAPGVGDGAAPGTPGSGWQGRFDSMLPVDRAGLEAQISACEAPAGSPEPSWLSGAPTTPINCVSWFVAFAFCVWDEGRLPSEAEWAFAALGGDEQRAFPWSAPSDARVIDVSFLVGVRTGELRPVGSVADRDAGRWGTHDLAGNLREWTLDVSPGERSRYETPCVDCVAEGSNAFRVVRGGDWATDDIHARSVYRSDQDESADSIYIGVRCVHTDDAT